MLKSRLSKQRKEESEVPKPPHDRELSEYRPSAGVTLEDFLATRIDYLMEQAPPGTWTSEPERIVAGWLTENDIPFTPQESFDGGRLPGGSVVDFVITLRPGSPIALRVMSYWHESLEARYFDEVSKVRVISKGFRVEDIWEDTVRDPKQLEERMWAIILGAGIV